MISLHPQEIDLFVKGISDITEMTPGSETNYPSIRN